MSRGTLFARSRLGMGMVVRWTPDLACGVRDGIAIGEERDDPAY